MAAAGFQLPSLAEGTEPLRARQGHDGQPVRRRDEGLYVRRKREAREAVLPSAKKLRLTAQMLSKAAAAAGDQTWWRATSPNTLPQVWALGAPRPTKLSAASRLTTHAAASALAIVNVDQRCGKT